MKTITHLLTYLGLAFMCMPQTLLSHSGIKGTAYNKELRKKVWARTVDRSKVDVSPTLKKGDKRIVHPEKATTAQLMFAESAQTKSAPTRVAIAQSMATGPLNPTARKSQLTVQVPRKENGTLSILQQSAGSFLSFDFQESGQYGPSSDGSVGSEQYILGTKGRIRSFSKSTGEIDGVLNISHDHFFSSISNGRYTADPNIIFDPLSQRWFLAATAPGSGILLAMSDGDPITAQTIWSFITVDTPTDPGFEFFPLLAGFDYTTLGVDNNAVLCAADISNVDASYASSAVYVLPKESLLSGGPVEIFGFRNLVDQNTLQGPYGNQGAQNFDSNPQFSYFAASDAFDFLVLGVSQQILLGTVSYTSEGPMLSLPFSSIQFETPYIDAIPSPVLGTPPFHMVLGNTSPHLSATHIRNNTLWTCTYIGVDNTGASNPSINPTRNGVRYWSIDLSGSTPVVTVDGTLFAASPTNDFNQRHFLTPSIMTNANGQVVIGATTCGANEFLNASVTQVINGVAATPFLYTQSSSNYFAQEDWEFTPFARWGDHSRTSPDPSDNTFWTCQLWCPATNAWGGQVAHVQLD